MAKPNKEHHNPDPAYLRELIAASGLTQVQCAERIGIDPATLRCYIMPVDAARYMVCPYLAQYALENLSK